MTDHPITDCARYLPGKPQVEKDQESLPIVIYRYHRVCVINERYFLKYLRRRTAINYTVTNMPEISYSYLSGRFNSGEKI